jgi:hypothetical protein
LNLAFQAEGESLALQRKPRAIQLRVMEADNIKRRVEKAEGFKKQLLFYNIANNWILNDNGVGL